MMTTKEKFAVMMADIAKAEAVVGAGMDGGGYLSAVEFIPYAVSPLDRRIVKPLMTLAEKLSDEEAARAFDNESFHLTDYAGIIPSEDWAALIPLLLENLCKNAAWTLGDRTGVPFIQHESKSFQVSVKWGKQDAGLESAVGPGRIDFFLPQNAGRPDATEQINLRDLLNRTERAVVQSFMMHDVATREMLEAGDKDGAAAFLVGSSALATEIVQSCISKNKNEAHDFDQNIVRLLPASAIEELENISMSGGPGRSKKNHVIVKNTDSDMSRFVADTLVRMGRSIAAEVSNGTDTGERVEKIVTVGKWAGADGKEDDNIAVGKTADADGASALRRLIDSLKGSLQVASFFRGGEDDDGGDEDGDSPSPSPSDAIINSMMSPQAGDGDAEGDGKGDADAEGGAEGDQQEPGDTDEDGERRRAFGLYGSTEEGQQLLNILSCVDYDRAIAEETPVEWNDHLNATLLRAIGIDRVYTWQRPNRRHIASGLYLPGFRRKRIRKLGVGIDESGSIDLEKLRLFNEEMIRVIDTVNPEGVDIFHFSTNVQEESLVQGEAWEAKQLCSGGTRFSAAYQAIKNRVDDGEQYDAIIFFTDMQDSSYAGLKLSQAQQYLPEGVPFFWVTWGAESGKGSTRPEFGTLINMTTNEIEEHGEQ